MDRVQKLYLEARATRLDAVWFGQGQLKIQASFSYYLTLIQCLSHPKSGG